MPTRTSTRRLDRRELAAEIIRRAGDICIIRLSDPPTSLQRLQLAAARLQGSPIALMPVRCHTVDEWLERYAKH
jgi:hypothetical protein